MTDEAKRRLKAIEKASVGARAAVFALQALASGDFRGARTELLGAIACLEGAEIEVEQLLGAPPPPDPDAVP